MSKFEFKFEQFHLKKGNTNFEGHRAAAAPWSARYRWQGNMAAAVYHSIMMRVIFFPSRCKPCHHCHLRPAAEHADRFLRRLYGDAYRRKLHMYLQRHWSDIIQYAGEDRRFIRNVYPAACRTSAQAAQD